MRQALAVLVEAIPGLSNVANGLQWTVKHRTGSDLGDRMTSLGLRQLAHARHLAHVDECPALAED
ncbi:hypothetical protein [Streptomyces sp. NPDC052693]|uniref:hypothetical protein n=1 Tax=Streptomyces sp. NPDC052693 TaxID=3155814 RepID=UPI00342061B7